MLDNSNTSVMTAGNALQKFAVPIAIVIAGVLIAGAVYLSNTGRGSAGGPSEQLPSVDIRDVKIAAHNPVIGEESAPVTLAYWFDYQCPFCKAVDVGGVPQIHIDPALPMLVKDYVETGKLKIVFKDYAFLGEDSTTAALYKHAVWDLYPGKFYEWHEAMFHAQDEEHGGFGNEETILELIRTISGLDASRLKQQVADKREEYLALIEEDRGEGASFGIQGTPAFITGTTLIPGANDPDAFKSAIDAQL